LAFSPTKKVGVETPTYNLIIKTKSYC